MTQSNKAVLTQAERQKRADLALTDLTSNGGILSPEQANQFIDFILDEPTLLKQARHIRMTAPEMKINSMGFGSRILRAARQTGSALDAGGNDRYVRAADRAKPATSQIKLNTQEVIAEVRIPYEVLEDNIEGLSFEAHVIRSIASRVALDLEEYALWADKALATAGPTQDLFLGLEDGWMKRISTNIYDNEDAGATPSVFTQSLLQLPQKYLRNLGTMKAFVTHAARINYMQYLQSRGTALGDAAVQGTAPLRSAGLPLEGVAALAMAPTTATGSGIITDPRNLLWGIQREITLETDRDIRAREHIIVVTARVAVQVDDVNAAVRIDDMGDLADSTLAVRVVNTDTDPVNTKEVV